ncbi:MAG: flagellar hook-length control protein FliK, partial [Oscillospiraceae bacterium]
KADNGILESKAAKDTAQAMWDKATADTAQEMANKSHIQGQKNEKPLNETEPTQVNVMADQPVMNTLNPDNINIKVGEAVDTTSENFAKDFSDKIVYKLNQDIKEFQIELNPQGMGKVSIKVEFVANKAFVSLSCENAKTQTLLAQSSDTIRSIIQQNVGSETVVVIHEENQPQQYQQSQQQNEQSQQEQHHEGAKQKPSDDSITFVNQLRLGLVDVTKQ